MELWRCYFFCRRAHHTPSPSLHFQHFLSTGWRSRWISNLVTAIGIAALPPFINSEEAPPLFKKKQKQDGMCKTTWKETLIDPGYFFYVNIFKSQQFVHSAFTRHHIITSSLDVFLAQVLFFALHTRLGRGRSKCEECCLCAALSCALQWWKQSLVSTSICGERSEKML